MVCCITSMYTSSQPWVGFNRIAVHYNRSRKTASEGKNCCFLAVNIKKECKFCCRWMNCFQLKSLLSLPPDIFRASCRMKQVCNEYVDALVINTDAAKVFLEFRCTPTPKSPAEVDKGFWHARKESHLQKLN